MIEIKNLTSDSKNFRQQLDKLLFWEDEIDSAVGRQVEKIVSAVKAQGDVALVRYSNRFDNMKISNPDQFIVSPDVIKNSLKNITVEQKTALDVAANRIRDFHERQVSASWSFKDKDGTLLGQQITPIEKVGIYVPGGKAAYPSTVLMNAIPAQVAGVANIIMTVPQPNGEVNELVLAAAAILGIDKVYALGGAQAIAALAYGTDTVPSVDKIVGPGNIYVALAKRMVYGKVGIDMIAGPSEILVICDGQTSADWIAMDLFSQAEHDENAQAILICPDKEFLNEVQDSINNLLPEMERKDIIKKSLCRRGALIQVQDIEEAIEIANEIAPEHLELSIKDPESWLPKIKHAGAVFLGRYTTEVLGDYCAGPNHVLPTARTARFSSPLGVYDFQKRTSILSCSRQGATELGKIAATLAYGEGLTAHARSAEYRGE